MAGHSKDRAMQFLPFNGLLGFYHMIGEKRRFREPKRELSDDQLLRLDWIFKTLHAGDRARVVFYKTDHYEMKDGIVEDINLYNKTMTIGGVVISCADIWKLCKEK